MNFKAFILFSLLGIDTLAQAETFGKCYTADHVRGECVYLSTCPPLQRLVEMVPTHQERRRLSLSQCGLHNDEVLVCCNEKDRTSDNLPPIDNVIPNSRSDTKINPLLPKPGMRIDACGLDASDRLFGGNGTSIDEFPWMALLKYSKPANEKGFHCSGALISSRYVLTVAHCINGKEKPPNWELISVRLGDWDLITDVDCDESLTNERVCNDGPVDIRIELKIPHEKYDPQSKHHHNDIALLRLVSEVAFTRFIQPICLSLNDPILNTDFEGKSLKVAGWGHIESFPRSNLKVKIDINGVSQSECQWLFGSLNQTIIESQLCAGGMKQVDTCLGDSGAPLMQLDGQGFPTYWYVVGLVSYGLKPCGQKDWPGVYTRVDKFIPWISANVRP